MFRVNIAFGAGTPEGRARPRSPSTRAAAARCYSPRLVTCPGRSRTRSVETMIASSWPPPASPSGSICSRAAVFLASAEHDSRFVHAAACAPAGDHVVAVVPARDEADVVATALRSLFRQEFAGRLEIVLVDDESTDGTGDIARAARPQEGAAGSADSAQVGGPAARLDRQARRHAPGLHLMCAACRRSRTSCCSATPTSPSRRTSLDRLVAGAAARGTRCSSSLMVKLRCESPAERWFVPAFVFFFQKLYPFARGERSRAAGRRGGGRGDAGAARGAGARRRPARDPRRADRRLRARRADEETGTDLARPHRRCLQPAPLSASFATSSAW